MKIMLIPQIPLNLTDKITYEFEEEIITANANGVVETYDFSNLPDGKLEIDLESIETRMKRFPIKQAERVDGVLYVKLLNLIEPEEEKYYQEIKWLSPEEYVPPKEGEQYEDGSNVEG